MAATFTLTNHSLLYYSNKPRLRIRSEAMATEKLGIKIEKNPPESKLSQIGVRSWPKWGCPPSKFPWTYQAKETCYLLKGKVKVYPDEHKNEFVEFGAGDLVVFPKGMSCTWDVAETVLGEGKTFLCPACCKHFPETRKLESGKILKETLLLLFLFPKNPIYSAFLLIHLPSSPPQETK